MADAERAQIAREAIGAAVELGVGELLVLEDRGDRLRGARGDLGDHHVRGIGAIGALGAATGGQQLLALAVGEQRQL